MYYSFVVSAYRTRQIESVRNDMNLSVHVGEWSVGGGGGMVLLITYG